MESFQNSTTAASFFFLMLDTKLIKAFLTLKILSNELHKTTNKNSNLNNQRLVSTLFRTHQAVMGDRC